MSRRVLSLTAGVLLLACEDRDPMTQQPRADVYAPSPLFADGRAMRPPVPGSVSQEGYRLQATPSGGDPDAGQWLEQLPLPLTRALLEEGRQRFEVACATCHGLLADGNSMVARNMRARPPPSLLAPHIHASETAPTRFQVTGPPTGRLPHPPGYYYTVITDGFGLMPSYADMLAPEERWAVVAYLQALALSQAAPLALAPPDVQAQLLGGTP